MLGGESAWNSLSRLHVPSLCFKRPQGRPVPLSEHLCLKYKVRRTHQGLGARRVWEALIHYANKIRNLGTQETKALGKTIVCISGFVSNSKR